MFPEIAKCPLRGQNHPQEPLCYILLLPFISAAPWYPRMKGYFYNIKVFCLSRNIGSLSISHLWNESKLEIIHFQSKRKKILWQPLKNWIRRTLKWVIHLWDKQSPKKNAGLECVFQNWGTARNILGCAGGLWRASGCLFIAPGPM